MAKFRKKPIVIEAFLWTGGPDQEEDPLWIVEALKAGKARLHGIGTEGLSMRIDTLEGSMDARPGDWIILGVKGELYPCKPDIFEATYEAVDARLAEDAEPITPKWQPMSTAPRDGTEVILAVKSRAGCSGRCLVGHYMPGGHCIEDHPPIAAGWYFWNGCFFDMASKPLMWMPLPKVPEALEAKP